MNEKSGKSSTGKVTRFEAQTGSSGGSEEESGVSSSEEVPQQPGKRPSQAYTNNIFLLNDSDLALRSKSKSQAFCERLYKIIIRVLAFPFLTGERICFHRDDLEPTDEQSVKVAWQARKRVEELVNFDSVTTKNMYANILEQRRELLKTKGKYHFEEVDLTEYPKWDQNIINRLRATFQIFDISGDGVIDFEEFSTVLSEFGDKTSPDIRLKYFSKAKTDEFGTIGFEDFLLIMYELTEKPLDTEDDQSLANTFKKIDKNMSIRCKLDVLGQLQGGLF